MKKTKFIIMLVLLGVNIQLFASTGAQKEAEKLLNTVGMDKAFEQSIQQTINAQIRVNPNLTPYKDVMFKFFNKYMSFDSLKDDVIKIYTESFTEQELKDINTFYSTDTGKKTIRLIPQLMMKGNQLGAKKVQSHIEELKQMIDEETKRIQSEQNK